MSKLSEFEVGLKRLRTDPPDMSKGVCADASSIFPLRKYCSLRFTHIADELAAYAEETRCDTTPFLHLLASLNKVKGDVDLLLCDYAELSERSCREQRRNPVPYTNEDSTHAYDLHWNTRILLRKQFKFGGWGERAPAPPRIVTAGAIKDIVHDMFVAVIRAIATMRSRGDQDALYKQFTSIADVTARVWRQFADLLAGDYVTKRCTLVRRDSMRPQMGPEQWTQ